MTTGPVRSGVGKSHITCLSTGGAVQVGCYGDTQRRAVSFVLGTTESIERGLDERVFKERV